MQISDHFQCTVLTNTGSHYVTLKILVPPWCL